MKKIIAVVVLSLMVILMSACAPKGYTNISNDELKEMLLSDIDYQFIDVRTQEEFYDEHIPGFTINKDFYIFENDYSLLDNLDPSRPTVIMCRTGSRSVEAAKIFLKLGFEEVYNLTDGIVGWDGETTK